MTNIGHTALVAACIVGATGCVFGVQEQTVTRSGTHAAGSWKVLGIDVDSMAKGLSVKGGGGAEVKVDATVAALVPEGAGDDVFAGATLGFVEAANRLSLTMKASGEFAELLYFQGLSVSAPAGVNLELNADDTNVTVADMSGDVTVKCGSGRADVLAAGRVDIETDSGAVNVSAGLSLKVKTSAGSLAAGSRSGSIVDIVTDSGDIIIDTPQGGRLLSDSGLIDLKLEGSFFGDTTIDTTTGNIVVTLQKGTAYDLDVNSTNGAIDLQIGGVVLLDQPFKGPVNGGPRGGQKRLLSIRSVSGRITVTEK